MKFRSGDILYTVNHQKNWIVLCLEEADTNTKDTRIFTLVNKYYPLAVGKIQRLGELVGDSDTIICLTVDK